MKQIIKEAMKMIWLNLDNEVQKWKIWRDMIAIVLFFERNHEFYLRDSLQERSLANFLTLFRHHNLHPPFFVLYVPTFLL